MTTISQQAKALGYTPTVVERWARFFGEDRTFRLMNALEQPIQSAIRINTLREAHPEVLIHNLRTKGFELIQQADFPRFGYQIKSTAGSVGATIDYLLGKMQLQSLSSQIPVEILDPQKREAIADFCASPGAKLSQLAQWVNNQGIIVGFEKATRRIQRLKSNLTRLGCSAIIFRMDAIEAPRLDLIFDRILVDAPCTGSGIIRKDETRKAMKTREVKRLSRIQTSILSSAVECLQNPGKIVYSTCSLELEENELVISQILDRYPEISLKALPDLFGMEKGLDDTIDSRISSELRKSGRLYPDADKEGFFIALLHKE
ncbi:MAG: RsmB/NOP family class I SAM-dependent RNA methyltransferase [Candidatus Hodarchaeales archaeon]